MKLDYTDIHWSTPSRLTRTLVWANRGRCRLGPEIVAISYYTRKDDEETAFRHEFERHGKRRARIAWTDPAGTHVTPAAPKHLIFMGRIIDVELSDRQRLRCWNLFACSSTSSAFNNGNPLFIAAFGRQPEFAVEHWTVGDSIFPYVTPHGIEG